MLLPCPTCKKSISETSHTCVHCGDVLPSDWAEKRIEEELRWVEENNKQAGAAKPYIIGFLILVSLPAIIGILGSVLGFGTSGSNISHCLEVGEVNGRWVDSMYQACVDAAK